MQCLLLQGYMNGTNKFLLTGSKSSCTLESSGKLLKCRFPGPTNDVLKQNLLVVGYRNLILKSSQVILMQVVSWTAFENCFSQKTQPWEQRNISFHPNSVATWCHTISLTSQCVSQPVVHFLNLEVVVQLYCGSPTNPINIFEGWIKVRAANLKSQKYQIFYKKNFFLLNQFICFSLIEW